MAKVGFDPRRTLFGTPGARGCRRVTTSAPCLGKEAPLLRFKAPLPFRLIHQGEPGASSPGRFRLDLAIVAVAAVLPVLIAGLLSRLDHPVAALTAPPGTTVNPGAVLVPFDLAGSISRWRDKARRCSCTASTRVPHPGVFCRVAGGTLWRARRRPRWPSFGASRAFGTCRGDVCPSAVPSPVRRGQTHMAPDRGHVGLTRTKSGAGDRDRTGIASLEGWSSTIELRPRGGSAYRDHAQGLVRRKRRSPLRSARPRRLEAPRDRSLSGDRSSFAPRPSGGGADDERARERQARGVTPGR
jgi:hypothetical protein